MTPSTGALVAAESDRVGGRRSRLPTAAAWALLIGCAVALLGSWAASSPPGSSPDDDHHLASIWCSQGLQEGKCAMDPDDPDARIVPVLASTGAVCYWANPALGGVCQQDLESQTPVISTDKGNWDRSYPPYFYRFMSSFVGSDTANSVLVMRMATGVLMVLTVAALAALLPRPRRALATVPLLITSVPLSLSLLSSTNPSGWAIVGIATLLPALYVAFETSGSRQAALCVLALFATFLAGGSRVDGALFAAMSVIIVLVMRWGRLRGHPLPLVAAALAIGLSALLYYPVDRFSITTDVLLGADNQLSTFELLLTNLGSISVLILGVVGSGPMGLIGWFDTAFTPVLGVITISVWAIVLTRGWTSMFLAKVVGLALVGSAILFYPTYLLVRSGRVVTEAFQPRYLLPLLILFTCLSILGRRDVSVRLRPWLFNTIVVLFSGAHTIALHTQTRRYVTGLDVFHVRLGTDAEWWWDAPIPGPTAMWLIGSVAFTVVCIGVLRPCLSRGSEAGDDGSVPPGP